MYIGIDYGTKRVGLAVSDEEGRVAFPLEVVGEKDALARASALALERKAKAVVIGESKDLSGRDNPVMTQVRSFADALARAAGAPIIFEPEFMTSAQASRIGRGEHPRNARKQGAPAQEKLDASAAAVILQSFLDRMNSASAHE